MSEKLTRRDFVKIAGLGLGALAATRVLPNSLISSEQGFSSEKETTKTEEETMFDIEHEFNPEETEGLKQMFNNIGSGVEELRGELEDDSEKAPLEDFDKQLFQENGESLLEKVARLKTVYRQIRADIDMDYDIQKESLKLIETQYKRSIIILQIFHKVTKDQAPKDMAKKLYLETCPIGTASVPIDPLIGGDIYGEIGQNIWFDGFEIKNQNGRNVGTYPFTRRFIKRSGELLTDFLPLPTKKVTNIPDQKPPVFELESDKRPDLFFGNGRYKFLPVNTEVAKDIFSELEKQGLEKAFSKLAIIERISEEGSLAGWAMRFEQDEQWINLVLGGIEQLDEKTFSTYRNEILLVIKHEIFHTLIDRLTDSLPDKDMYQVYGSLIHMYKLLNPIYHRDETFNDVDLNISWDNRFNTELPSAGIELNRAILNSPNESLRSCYFISSSFKSISELMNTLSMNYSEDFAGLGKIWKSELFSVQFEPIDENLSDIHKMKKYRDDMKWLGDHLKYIWKNERDNMTHLERYLAEELIDRSEQGTLFSEVTYWMLGRMNIDSYTHYQLPGMVIYTSIIRGDRKFLNAIEKDYQEMVNKGLITEERKNLVLRKIKYFANYAKYLNEDSPGRIKVGRTEKRSIAGNTLEEFLADQFCLAFATKLGFDFNNPESSLRSRRMITKTRPMMQDLLAFFKSRNIAQVQNTV